MRPSHAMPGLALWLLLTACDPGTPVATTQAPAATVTASQTATAIVPTGTPTKLPTFTVQATPSRLPTLPLPTIDPSATADQVFFVQVNVPSGVGWGWIATNACRLRFNDWPIVQAFNWGEDGQLRAGVQSIACPDLYPGTLESP